jgi:hypothetical protein
LSATNAASDAATSAEIPTTDSSAHATTPIELPAIVMKPARGPPVSELRTIIAKPAPGVSVSSAAMGMNAQIIGRM